MDLPDRPAPPGTMADGAASPESSGAPPASEAAVAAGATEPEAMDVLAAALGRSPEQVAAVVAFGRFLAARAMETLSTALGQPVHIGRVRVQRLDPSQFESEDWASYHPIDVRWEAGGVVYAPLLLLPKAPLQTLLPAARGAADLPDMEQLGRLLRNLAERLTAALAGVAVPPVRLSLPDTGEASHDEQNVLLRVEHTLTVGAPGAETELAVIHLIPAAALAAVALPAAEAGASAISASSAPPTATAPVAPAAGSAEEAEAAISAGSTEPKAGERGARVGASSRAPATQHRERAGGGVSSTMEDTMAAATQPAGTSVHPVQFQPFEGELEGMGATNLDLLLDVGLRVSVELGRADLTIKDVLALGPGSVIELDKLAGEPVDIYVNDRLIAKGEVVVVDENFGVRVTDIVSPQKRLAKMR
jgi:flagellar motor switch protein FliN